MLVESFWRITMSLTPIQGFSFPLCILYLICFTGVYMCEEKFPTYNTCLGIRLCYKQQQQQTTPDCQLDGTRLNWESASHLSWTTEDLKVDRFTSRREAKVPGEFDSIHKSHRHAYDRKTISIGKGFVTTSARPSLLSKCKVLVFTWGIRLWQ